MKLLKFLDKKLDKKTVEVPKEVKKVVLPKIEILVLDSDQDLLDSLKGGKYPENVSITFSTDTSLVMKDFVFYDAFIADVNLENAVAVDKRLKELAGDFPVFRMSSGAPTKSVNVVLQKPFTLTTFEKKIREICGLAMYLKKTA